MIEAFDIIENTEVRKEFSLAFEKLDQIELIQLLSDLKYLPYKAFDDNFVDDAELENAIAQFRKEYTSALELTNASNIDEINIASEVLKYEQASPNKLTPREMYIIKEIVGLDSELFVHSVPLDTCSLLSRVIVYRFRVYDLNKGVLPNQRITKKVIKQFKASAKEIGFKNGWLELGNLLANQEALSLFCFESTILSKNIFGHCIFFELLTRKGKKLIRELGSDIKSKKHFSLNIKSQEARRVILDLSSHKTSEKKEAQVKGYILDIANKFMRRMLQVKLWTMGLYQGKLDNDFGPLSTTALVDYIRAITEDKHELSRVLYDLGDYQCSINIRYLLTKRFIPMEQSAIHSNHSSVSQLYDFVLEDKEHIRTTKPNKKREIEQKGKALKKTLEQDLRSESESIINGTRRKVRHYKAKTGILKFFSRLFKFVKNIVAKILKLLEKLFDLVKKSIKIIYAEIKEAFQNFRDGLNFLFGPRIVRSGSSITTDYDFDFDGITRIHAKPIANEVQKHRTRIKEYASAIYPTLNFVKTVIRWGIHIASGVGWVKILIGIAKLFREMLKRRKTVPYS